MPIYNNDCYGAKKERIVKEYYLKPIAQIKLLPDMKKDGCCGELKDRFFIFAYDAIRGNDKGTFFVGMDCAEQIIDMVNDIKAKASKPPLFVPQLFDPTIDHGFHGGYKGEIKTLNYDAMVLLMLIASIWDVKGFFGAPANILERITRNPLRTIGKYDVLKIKELIVKSDLFKHMEDLRGKGVRFGYFPINYFNTVVDFIESDELRKPH